MEKQACGESLPLAASGFAVVIIGLVEITEDTIYFVAVHLSTLLDHVSATECFYRYQHIAHGPRRFKRGETKL